MNLRSGDYWRTVEEDLIELIKPDVILRVLNAVNTMEETALTAWVSAAAPEVYQPVGLTGADAARLVAERPFAGLGEIAAVAGIGLDKLGDLVYAAAAAEAVNPQRVLVEEVYEVSALGDVALLAELAVPIPALSPAVRLEAVTAYIAIEGRPQTVEHRPVMRQRKLEDTWAELELSRRSRVWYLGAAASLATRAHATGRILLFPRLGDEFLDAPVMTIAPAADVVEVPPVSTQATDHEFYAFPEIEAAQLMLRLGEPPGENDDVAGWPDAYRFHAETGDVLLFGPSYPTDVEIRLGGSEIAWRRGGELVAADRSRDVAGALQAALASLGGAPVETGEGGAEVRRLTVAATSKTPGSMYLGIEAELDAVVERFANGKKLHALTFTRATHTGEVALALPGAGAPVEGLIELEGLLSRCVIEQEIGATDAPTGDDKIGVRLASDIEYSQRFEVAEAFEMSAVDVRVAEVAADTRLVVEVAAGDLTVTAAAVFEDAIGRVPAWQLLRFDAPLPVEPETSYEVRARVSRGQAVWLCGAGGAHSFLRRHQGNGSPARVDDVADGTPLIGEMRLRTDVPLDEPRLDLTLMPGAHPVSLRDVTMFDDGSFSALVDLTDALSAVQGAGTHLRLEAISEGTLTLRNPLIRYRMHIETGN